MGDIQRFPSGRHFACWLGLTPSERSSAQRRRLGKISKQGDVTAERSWSTALARRMRLPTVRSAPANRSTVATLGADCEQQRGQNKATVALANRLARIVWASWKYERSFDGNWANQPA